MIKQIINKIFGPSCSELAKQEAELRKMKKLKEAQRIDPGANIDSSINIPQSSNPLPSLHEDNSSYSESGNINSCVTPKSAHDTFLDQFSQLKPPVFSPPQNIGHYVLSKYTYEKVDLKVVPDNIHFESNMIGSSVDLVPEPDNIYDPGAISVYLNSQKIGYIPRNRLQKMIHDWNKNNKPIYSVISNIEIDESTENVSSFSIFLGFYYNIEQEVQYCESIQTRLVKTTKKDEFDDRQDNIFYSSVNDFIDLEYDSFSESYIVTNNSSELGETSASITKKLQEFDSTANYIGKIDSIDENDSGKYVVSITIYLKSM